MQQSELQWLQNHFPLIFLFPFVWKTPLFWWGFFWEVAHHPSENVKFSVTGVAFFVVFPLKWCWQSTNLSKSVPPSPSHADSFPCLQAILFFSPGWRWTDATKWMLRNWVGSKGGWSTLWKWNCSHPPRCLAQLLRSQNVLLWTPAIRLCFQFPRQILLPFMPM